MMGLTPAHLLIILVIALIVVGPGKLPELGAAIGKSIREFQKATGGIQDSVTSVLKPNEAQPQGQPPAPASVAPGYYAPPQYGQPYAPQYGQPQPQYGQAPVQYPQPQPPAQYAPVQYGQQYEPQQTPYQQAQPAPAPIPMAGVSLPPAEPIATPAAPDQIQN